MPATYKNIGVRFDYPDNWRIEEEALSDQRAVTVHSPGGGFWSVVVHSQSMDPGELVTAAMEMMRKEYDNLDTEVVTEEIADRALIGYDLNFYCLDLTNTSHIRSCRTDDATYLVFCQAEDREFEKLSLVFRAMLVSLLQQRVD